MRTWIIENQLLAFLAAIAIIALAVLAYRKFFPSTERVVVDYEPSVQPTIPVTSTTTIIGRPGPAGMSGATPVGGMSAGARVSGGGGKGGAL